MDAEIIGAQPASVHMLPKTENSIAIFLLALVKVLLRRRELRVRKNTRHPPEHSERLVFPGQMAPIFWVHRAISRGIPRLFRRLGSRRGCTVIGLGGHVAG